MVRKRHPRSHMFTTKRQEVHSKAENRLAESKSDKARKRIDKINDKRSLCNPEQAQEKEERTKQKKNPKLDFIGSTI